MGRQKQSTAVVDDCLEARHGKMIPWFTSGFVRVLYAVFICFYNGPWLSIGVVPANSLKICLPKKSIRILQAFVFPYLKALRTPYWGTDPNIGVAGFSAILSVRSLDLSGPKVSRLLGFSGGC